MRRRIFVAPDNGIVASLNYFFINLGNRCGNEQLSEILIVGESVVSDPRYAVGNYYLSQITFDERTVFDLGDILRDGNAL